MEGKEGGLFWEERGRMLVSAEDGFHLSLTIIDGEPRSDCHNLNKDQTNSNRRSVKYRTGMKRTQTDQHEQ